MPFPQLQLREGFAPAGPRRRKREDTGSIVSSRWRWLGAVGNSCIVAYRARSPTRSAAEGHAHHCRIR
jgi:hypothetical protein